MSVPVDENDKIRETHDRALAYLRIRPNPFDSLVRSRFPDDDFAELHVDAVLREQRELLLAIIDSYRCENYTSLADLPGSRVITVLGARGAGKTHMLQSLSHRCDGRRQLLVRRQSGYDPTRSFEEHVTFEILRALSHQDPADKTCRFDELAPYLTRHLVGQALCGLTATDRLCVKPRRWWSRFMLSFGGAAATWETFDRFQRDMNDCEPMSLLDVAQEHGISADFLWQLVETHLREYEQGKEALSRIRHRLYLACARHALKHDTAAFNEFLEGDFRSSPHDFVPRDEFVTQLRNALIELCALFQQPVVLTCDNFESILAPRGVFDEEAGRAFASGVAQAVDAGPGLLFLLFIEQDMFYQLIRVADSFAKDRLQQGVMVPRHGPVDRLELLPPTGGQILDLVNCRVRKVLDGYPERDRLPALFPFSQIIVEQLADNRGLVLRGKLIRLREAYSNAVFGKIEENAPLALQTAPSAPPNVDLAHRWKTAIAVAAKGFVAPHLMHLQRLHQGLGRILQLARQSADERCVFSDVNPVATFGEDPRYGVATLFSCSTQRDDETSLIATPVAVAFLLARGSGQPAEMRQKLSLFEQEALPCKWLLLLRPSDSRGDDCLDELPAATRKQLEQSASHDCTVCRGVPLEDLRAVFAVPAWLESMEDCGDMPADHELGEFLRRNCRSLLRLLLPPQWIESKEKGATA